MTLSLTGMKRFYPLILYASDILAFTLAFCFSSTFLYDSPFLYTRLFTLIFFILLFNYASNNLYKDKRSLFNETDLFSLIKSYFITTLFAIIIIFSFQFSSLKLNTLLICTLITAFLLTIICRIIIAKILHFFRKKGYDRHRAYFFGKNEDLQNIIKEDSSLGYTIKGATNNIAELKKELPKIDTVFILQELITDDLLNLMITNTKITWKIIPSALNLVIEPVDFDEFKDYPIINLQHTKKNYYEGLPKRVFDLIITSIALIILSPLFLIVAAIIKISMPGPVFFRQERLGKNLKPFSIYKFRTMVLNAEALKQKLETKNEVKGLFKMKKDPRITRFGQFLRRSSIDELPQLLNILKGDMSLVGPRPHLESELAHYTEWRRMRFTVKPGLTGLWQIKGRHELNFDKAVLYDIYYARHMSLALDIEIIVRTVPAILMNNGRF
jgi:exopolysaccharide biosynthesis polyprenyl glycosylphosphotransferase